MERPRELVWMVFVGQLRLLSRVRLAVLVFQNDLLFHKRVVTAMGFRGGL